jgi:hypothetical protein
MSLNPIKICRLNFTDGTILFIHWLLNLSKIRLTEKIKMYLENFLNKEMQHFFTSSGFYDKTLKPGSYNFNFDNYDTSLLNKNSLVNVFFYKIIEHISNADELCIHISEYIDQELCYNLSKYHTKFFSYFSPKKTIPYVNKERIYEFLNNKRVLIMSSFCDLIKYQIESGNAREIFHDVDGVEFPNFLNIIYYKTPYTFFNDGPENNMFETSNKICNEISEFQDKFDCILIGFGSYNNIIGDYFYKNYNKSFCSVGNDMQFIFGILNNRYKGYGVTNEEWFLKKKDYWITEIPEELKPENYMQIEDGCFW